MKKLFIICSLDPGSEIRDPEKTYSGSRGQKGTGSRIRNPGQKSRIWLFRGQIRRVQKSSSSPVSINACSSNVICHVTSMQELTFKNTVLVSGIRDPGSGKNLFRIPDPGVKKAPDPGSRIRIRNTAAHILQTIPFLS